VPARQPANRAGRKRKPMMLHQLHGTVRRGDEHKGWLETDAKFPALPIGAPPDGLTEDQTVIWYEVMASVPRGLLRTTDARLVMSYCMLVDYMNKANAAWNAGGETMDVQGRSGRVLNPLVAGAMKASMALLKVQAELGFTPSCRTRVDLGEPMKLVGPSPEDEFFD
jgi:P27 family predicted phage terminase small subunit